MRCGHAIAAGKLIQNPGNTRMFSHRYVVYIGIVFLVAGVFAMLTKAYPHGLIQDLLAALFFIAAAAVFAHYFLEEDTYWWALLPAGIFFTLAIMMLLSAFSLIKPGLQSVVFFSGASLTFYCLWFTHRSMIQFIWARLLAFISAVIALSLFSRRMGWIDSSAILALLLLVTGIWLLLRNKK